MPHTPTLRTGKLPAQPARPHLLLSRALTTSLPEPPPAVVYDRVPDWGMLGNDLYGDCVEAYLGHAVEQITAYTSGTEQVVTPADTLRIYSAITGFNPSDGSTDQGTLMQDAFTYWRKTGIYGGHRIAAFAAVTLTDWAEIENAVNLFGHVSVGFNFPASAMQQFDAGQPWTVEAGSPLEGGHCVMLVGYDADWLYVVTWGKVQRMARAFWTEFVDEAWVVITRDTIKAEGVNAFGGVLDLGALGADFAALTGEPNPFPHVDPTPVPVPPPTPVPAPTPGPAPVIDAADQALHDSQAVDHLLRGYHASAGDVRHLRVALRRWETEKGFTS